MAYRRSYSRRPRTTRKRTTRKGYGGRSTPRRRYPTRKRRYTKRMTNKRILNISSTKKRDNMQQITNIDPGSIVPGGLGLREALLNGSNIYLIPWIPTARPAIGSDKQGGQPIEEAVRTATTCYMRGVKENISIRTADGAPWKWRRICFRMKGDGIYRYASAGARTDYLSTGADGEGKLGSLRPATNWLQDVKQANYIQNTIFAGTNGIDWTDPFIATVDTNQVSIAYD